MPLRLRLLPAIPLLLLSLVPSSAQTIEQTEGIPFTVTGKIRPRAATEIKASGWSVGGETLDRDFADYQQYKKYLGPLGAKAIRLQAGWAKTEREAGKYDWAWLDAIIDDATAQGVRPWLNVSYGNLLYPGGGGIGLSDGMPTSPVALEAWGKWSRALVKRYKDRVNEWEIWNEPDLNKTTSVAEYLTLFIPTAEMIRAEQPDSRIYALSLSSSVPFATEFLRSLRDQGKLGLVDAITIHGYPTNPSITTGITRFRELVALFSDKIQVREGESGAPSARATVGALKNHDWTELLQSKWDLCRMLSHYGHAMPYNLFTLCDLSYASTTHNGLNPKGLLKANPDKTIAYAKPAYFAAQNVFAIFDDTWKPDPALHFTFPEKSLAARLSCFGFKKMPGDAGAFLLWFGDKTPSASNTVTPVTVTIANVKFTEPFLVDLRTGLTYEIPSDHWKQNTAGATFIALPVYDSPVFIAEKSSLPPAL